ncbi:MAG: hypothetical protein ACRDO7_16295 [Nocardioidaceae bacterium]
MTIQLDAAVPGRVDRGAGDYVLLITAADGRTARHTARVVEDLHGETPDIVNELTVRVRGVDARAAVDVLAELTWAGVTPETFSLG